MKILITSLENSSNVLQLYIQSESLKNISNIKAVPEKLMSTISDAILNGEIALCLQDIKEKIQNVIDLNDRVTLNYFKENVDTIEQCLKNLQELIKKTNYNTSGRLTINMKIYLKGLGKSISSDCILSEIIDCHLEDIRGLKNFSPITQEHLASTSVQPEIKAAKNR